MIKKYLLMLTLIAAPLLVLPVSVAAVDILPSRVCDKDKDSRDAAPRDSTLCAENRATTNNPDNNPLFGPDGVLTTVINILSIIVGIAAVIMIILGGLRYITSGSNPQDVTNARERIIYSMVALVVAAMAQVIVKFVINKGVS